jgi:hypothetical protein
VKARAPAAYKRVTLTYAEAAAALGLSLTSFREHVLPDLRVIEVGSARLLPVVELRRWAERQATLRAAGG